MSFEIDCENFSEDMLPKLTIKIIGQYSIDGDSQYHADLSQMKYYIPPSELDNVFFDLNVKDLTFNRFINYNRLENVLRWVSENFNLLEKPLSHQEGQWLDSDFICRRGVLKTLLCTPCQRNEAWIICATKYRGTIYLCDFYLDKREHHCFNYITESQKQLGLQNIMFKKFMVADHPSNKPNTSVPLSESEKFHCMIKADFGNHSLLYEAEIDAVSSQQPIMDTLTDNTFELIQLKTLSKIRYREIGTSNNKCSTIPFKKAIIWWSQNYLAGIEKLICGIKNYYGQVKMIKEFSTHNLSQLLEPRVNVDKCKMFLKTFLDNVKEIVIKDYNECMYKFHFDAHNSVINYSEEAPNNEMYSFLKSSFIEKAENYNTTSHCQ